MNDTPHRKPAAFRLDSPDVSVAGQKKTENEEKAAKAPARKPAAIRNLAVIMPEAVDVFSETDMDALTPLPAASMQSRFSLFGLFTGAIGILISLAIGLWTDALIRDLFTRATWLGWLALGVSVVAALALVIIVIREGLALRRLASVQSLREETAEAAFRNNEKEARQAVAKLVAIAEPLPSTARGRAALHELRDDVIDGHNLIRLAETEILRPLDRQAREMILSASKRVSLVTAVSPRALVDIGYVIFECARLIRRLSELYGGRPGTLGFIKLAKNVIAHLAVTGTVAMSDGLVQQVLGHGVAAKLSARLGEGVINGLMTARIGISAMDLVRPFPFDAEKRPGISDFMSDLTKLGGTKKD
ncbi:MAG: YcjF family protein [Phyllobacterium sp.]